MTTLTTKPQTTYRFVYYYALAASDFPVIMYRRSVQNLAAQRRWFKKRYPDAALQVCEVSRTHQIYSELLASCGPAYDRLIAKCRWEGVGPLAVIEDWGDPREWQDYRTFPK